jgi:hypothetical protein
MVVSHLFTGKNSLSFHTCSSEKVHDRFTLVERQKFIVVLHLFK